MRRSTRSTRSRRALAVAAVVSLVVATAACGGSKKKASTTPTTVEVTTTTVPNPNAVLTGVPIGDEDHLERPAVVIKVENSPEARPQSGMHKADVIFEELVEGGVVRFLCVFQSQDAESVGPVRSVRPVDPDIVSPLGGLFAYSGGAPQFERLIKKAPVRLVGYDQLTKAYTLRKEKRAPHNLYTSTEKLYDAAKDSDKTPPQLFTYGEITSGTPVTHATVVMGGRTTADWDWDTAAGRWKRTTNGVAHTVEGGQQLAFANVVIQYVRYRDTTSRDQAGFPVPTADVVGTGKATILSGGNMVKATWTKRGATDVTTWTDSAGVPINFQPGPTWVMLAPLGAQTTTR